MLQMALLVPATLTLPVPLRRFGMGLSVLPGIIPMKIAPLLLAISADLAILGIGFNLAAVVLSPALPLTVGTTASELLGTKGEMLEQFLAISTAGIVHQEAPDRDASPSL